MLPLDEDYFEIKADERKIYVPKIFEKGIGVQGDMMAETIIFRINRFFDAVDLHTCDIWVQWERVKDPSAKFVTQLNSDEAAKLVVLSEDGEFLLFGWSISQLVAEVAGQIKFSIRFIKESEDGQLQYSFSTTPATLTVNPGLDYDIHNCEPDQPNWLFDEIIENSETSTGPSAARPVFSDDNNLNGYYNYLNDDGTATLSVLARSADGDSGFLTYEWYYAEDDKTVGSRITTVTPATNDTPAEFVVDGSEGKDITGFYWAKAINKMGNRQKSASSRKAEFPGPNEPVFDGALSDAILKDGETTLALSAKQDAVHGEHNTTTYQWYKKAASADTSFSAIDGATLSALKVKAPGIYKVVATNEVNLQEKDAHSAPCTVYDHPGEVIFTDLAELVMNRGQSYKLTFEAPTNEFARGDIKFSWWFDYDGSGSVLDANGVPSTSDKVVALYDNLTEPAITIEQSLLEMADGATLHCVASNTITVGDESVTRYSQSAGYTLKR